MLRGLCLALAAACLWTGPASAACQVVEGASPRETEIARKVCDSVKDWEDIRAVEYGDPGLFVITISEALYRAFRADKVGAEGLAFKMLSALKGLDIERPKIFYYWSNKKIAEAGYTMFGNEPYLEMKE